MKASLDGFNDRERFIVNVSLQRFPRIFHYDSEESRSHCGVELTSIGFVPQRDWNVTLDDVSKPNAYTPRIANPYRDAFRHVLLARVHLVEIGDRQARV